jgi:hypothetical protein
MINIEIDINSKIRKLPFSLKLEVMKYIEFLSYKHQGKSIPERKFKFDWEGGLAELKDDMSSVDLQHKAMD